ncbi:MAG: division/cell wall cluster transcriptional repressor MraZ [Deltaproteobacteria bacterium]|nr:division/cell wall cluster transcriptional repressor MraZ [Deltaproteobacteria bacterium]
MSAPTPVRFRGEFAQRLDEKARLAIPVAYRSALDSAGDKRLILVRSTSGPCIQAWAMRDWQTYEERILALPPSDPTVQKLLRFVVSGATPVEPDSHGRVVLPQTLRQYAGLDAGAEVMLVATINRFEVWRRDAWQTHADAVAADLPSWSADLARLGL